jgi:hypothetical protein
MSKRLCMDCKRVVTAKRVIGIGTLLLVIITGGFALSLLPFYRKRCPICKGTDLKRRRRLDGYQPEEKVGSGVPPSKP